VKYLDDKIVKKALAMDSDVMNEYVSEMISEVMNIPIEDLRGNLKLVYPEIAASTHTVNSIADLAFTNGDCYISIEINYHNKGQDVDVKNMLYIYQLALRQTRKATDYARIKPVHQILINVDDIFGKDRLLYTVSSREEEFNLPYLRDLSKVFIINLEYFYNHGYSEAPLNEKDLFRIFHLFTDKEDKEIDKIYKEDGLMKKVKETFDSIAKEIDGVLYLDRQKFEEAASFNDGLIEGEAKTKQSVAKNLLDMGIEVEAISKATELTIEEINNLK